MNGWAAAWPIVWSDRRRRRCRAVCDAAAVAAGVAGVGWRRRSRSLSSLPRRAAPRDDEVHDQRRRRRTTQTMTGMFVHHELDRCPSHVARSHLHLHRRDLPDRKQPQHLQPERDAEQHQARRGRRAGCRRSPGSGTTPSTNITAGNADQDVAGEAPFGGLGLHVLLRGGCAGGSCR